MSRTLLVSYFPSLRYDIKCLILVLNEEKPNTYNKHLKSGKSSINYVTTEATLKANADETSLVISSREICLSWSTLYAPHYKQTVCYTPITLG